MKTIQVDIAIIGGGPAGLAAALEASKQGAKKVLVIERDIELGGILQQCIHDGFGLHYFNKRMSGGQYAQAFIDQLDKANIETMLNTMVLEVTSDKIIYTVSKNEGMCKIECGAIILAMGCRERTRNQIFIYGSRPSGVLTAGSVQRYINMEGYIPGKKVVILGSGDIGLIMARRMTLEGMEVEGVYEVMQNPGGLTRNIVQCLDEFNIPLHLGTTVSEIHGERRLEGVTVAQVDENRKPIQETSRYIECDLLVLAVGLLPENELSKGAGIEIDPMTQGPVLDESFMTSVEGIFACGNVAAVFDLVDYVSESGEYAARGAVRYLNGELNLEDEYCSVTAGNNVGLLIPQRFRAVNIQGELPTYMRVREKKENVILSYTRSGDIIYKKKHQFVDPPEMITAKIPKLELHTKDPIVIDVKELS